MPHHRQVVLLVVLGILLLALVSVHTVPEVVASRTAEAASPPPPSPAPSPLLRVRWTPPGSALAGRLEARLLRRPIYGPLPEQEDASDE